MNSDDLGRDLHDRATRGEQLSPENQMQLEAWYIAQDRVEMEILNGTMQARDSALLQTQVDAAMEQLTTLSRRIQKTAAENAALRREINILRRRLGAQVILQPT
jgi:thiazole synthase ThiGH ThiG subunit